ncbi:MAG: hypothetical protein V1913_04135 [Fibrobacterota bacterium]
MNIETVGAQRTDIEEMQKNQRTEQEVKAEPTGANASAQGDTVEISEEGRRKSTASRADASGNDSPASDAESDSGSGDINAAGDVTVDDLKKELHKKKSEVKSKQAKLDEAAQAAANDPSKEAQMKILKNQVTQLEKEASKIQSKVYSS